MKICVISSDPFFLGGVSLYTWDIVNSLKRTKENEITWIYRGGKNRTYDKEGIKFIELKVSGRYPLNEILFNFELKRFLERKKFDIINSHAIWGFWIRNFRKKGKQELIHTYHGSTYYFFKNHFKRPGIIKKLESLISMLLGFIIERPPWRRANKIICVSEHVKSELENLYGKRKNIEVVNANIDTRKFKKRNKENSKKKIDLSQKNWYGIYVGQGGFWTKGLDRVIKISEEIYKKDETYRLLVVGSDKSKVKHLINREFIKLVPPASREILPYYYSASDVFFNLSRYEGGDPTLATAEAIASGCLVVCSKDAKQESVKEKKGVLIFEGNYKKEAERIRSMLKRKILKVDQ